MISKRGSSVWLRPVAAWGLIALASLLPVFVMAPPAEATNLPASRLFWVQRSSGWQHVRCYLVASRSSLNVYASSGDNQTRQEAAALADVYRTQIWPTDVRIFGSPRLMGTVSIVMSNLDGGTLGYFDENDLLRPASPLADPAHSNHGNVLYVRPERSMPDSNKRSDLYEAVAHELQHLIDYRIRVIDHRVAAEDDWLNEGLSFYAQVANRYWTPRDDMKIRAAAAEPGWPVTALNESNTFLRRHARTAYGRAGLFVSYLAARFGPTFIREVVASPQTGMSAIDAVLKTQSPRVGVADVFSDWAVANYLNRPRGKFGYGSLPPMLHSVPQLAASPVGRYPYDSTNTPRALTVAAWGQTYLRFTPPHASDLRISLQAQSSRVRAEIVGENSAGVISPRVIGLHLTAGGQATGYLKEFGGFYDRATLVLSNAGSLDPNAPPQAVTIRVKASIARAGYEDSVTGVALR